MSSHNSGALISSLSRPIITATTTSSTSTGPPPPPPPDPLFVLRGHGVAVQCVRFLWNDDGQILIVSGDSSGHVRIWSLTTRRTLVTWMAHDTQGVLHVDVLYGEHMWQEKNPGHKGTVIVTQGKDGFLAYWSLSLLLTHTTPHTSTSTCATTSPTKSLTPLAMIHTQSYTFCHVHHISHITREEVIQTSAEPSVTSTSTSSTTPKSGLGTALAARAAASAQEEEAPPTSTSTSTPFTSSIPSTYAAIPGENSSHIHIWDIHTQTRILTIDCSTDTHVHVHVHVHDDEDSCDESHERKYGMVMALRWVRYEEQIYLVVGMESGHIQIWDVRKLKKMMEHKIHQQPILNLDLSADGCSGISCSAEATIVKFTIDYQQSRITPSSIPLPHEGVSDVRIRCHDHSLFASAGWDKRVRLFSYNKLKPLAVLSFHTDTVYAVDFVTPPPTPTSTSTSNADTPTTTNTASTLLPSQQGLMMTSSKDGRIAVYDIYGPNSTKRVVRT